MRAITRTPCPRLLPVRRPVDSIAASVEPEMRTRTNYCIARSTDPESRMLSLTIFAVAARPATQPQAGRTLPSFAQEPKNSGPSDLPEGRGIPKS